MHLLTFGTQLQILVGLQLLEWMVEVQVVGALKVEAHDG